MKVRPTAKGIIESIRAKISGSGIHLSTLLETLLPNLSIQVSSAMKIINSNTYKYFLI